MQHAFVQSQDASFSQTHRSSLFSWPVVSAVREDGVGRHDQVVTYNSSRLTGCPASLAALTGDLFVKSTHRWESLISWTLGKMSTGWERSKLPAFCVELSEPLHFLCSKGMRLGPKLDGLNIQVPW